MSWVTSCLGSKLLSVWLIRLKITWQQRCKEMTEVSHVQIRNTQWWLHICIRHPCTNLHAGEVLLYLPLRLILMHKKQILLSGGIQWMAIKGAPSSRPRGASISCRRLPPQFLYLCFLQVTQDSKSTSTLLSSQLDCSEGPWWVLLDKVKRRI